MSGKGVVLVVALVAALTAGGQANIVQVAQSQPQLTTLVAAVQAAGLTEALSTPDVPLTLFAPINDAFTAALAMLNLPSGQTFPPTDLLADVLLYHAIPDIAAMAEDLVDGMVLPTLLEGANVTVSLRDGGVFILSPGSPRPAKVIQADVPSGDARGSVIHIIDGVLLPAAA